MSRLVLEIRGTQVHQVTLLVDGRVQIGVESWEMHSQGWWDGTTVLVCSVAGKTWDGPSPRVWKWTGLVRSVQAWTETPDVVRIEAQEIGRE